MPTKIRRPPRPGMLQTGVIGRRSTDSETFSTTPTFKAATPEQIDAQNEFIVDCLTRILFDEFVAHWEASTDKGVAVQ